MFFASNSEKEIPNNDQERTTKILSKNDMDKN